MNPSWLDQLAPGHAPTAPGWWPPAPGWWAVGLLCVLLTLMLLWQAGRPERRPRRAALRQLRLIRASDADGAVVARAIQNLMRRYALAVFGPERVARLSGEAWLSFVIDSGGEALAGSAGRTLLAAAFGNEACDEREQWIAGAECFIKRARAKSRLSADVARRLLPRFRPRVAASTPTGGGR